uniref:Uncharacterized protein n=1 Tax=Anopheles merus TaxID=30066 RepID=A0A182UW02_ANOME
MTTDISRVSVISKQEIVTNACRSFASLCTLPSSVMPTRTGWFSDSKYTSWVSVSLELSTDREAGSSSGVVWLIVEGSSIFFTAVSMKVISTRDVVVTSSYMLSLLAVPLETLITEMQKPPLSRGEGRYCTTIHAPQLTVTGQQQLPTLANVRITTKQELSISISQLPFLKRSEKLTQCRPVQPALADHLLQDLLPRL